MMANIWKMEILIIDHEDISLEDIKTMLGQMDYISAGVITAQKKRIKWHDDLPINQIDQQKEAINKMFPPTQET